MSFITVGGIISSPRNNVAEVSIFIINNSNIQLFSIFSEEFQHRQGGRYATKRNTGKNININKARSSNTQSLPLRTFFTITHIPTHAASRCTSNKLSNNCLNSTSNLKQVISLVLSIMSAQYNVNYFLINMIYHYLSKIEQSTSSGTDVRLVTQTASHGLT